MGRLEPPFTYSQPPWWLAQQPLTGFGAKPQFGDGAFGVEGNTFGDGTFGGDAFGDGVFGFGVFGGADVFGGWTTNPAVLTLQTLDPFGGGGFGDNLFGDVRANPNPYVDVGLAIGFGPDDWGDNDPTFQILEGAPRYAVFGGGACQLPDGTTVTYHDSVVFSTPIVQGAVPGASVTVANSTATNVAWGFVNYTVSVYALKPARGANRTYRVTLSWMTGYSLANPSAEGWVPWDGVTLAPGGIVNPVVYSTYVDLDDDGCGTAWPTVGGPWPTSLKVGGVTSPFLGAGPFTVHT